MNSNIVPEVPDLDPLSNLGLFEALANPQPANQYGYPQEVKHEDTNTYPNNQYQNTSYPEIKPEKVKKKIKTEGRSKYTSEKIQDKNFPFYGCSVCNICFATLNELDLHVSSHKDRITSYDLRLKSQLKKKKLKKELKKKKKLKKLIKVEKELLDLEIKPEDGYIGTEKAADVNGEKENDCKDDSNIKVVQNNATLAEVIAKKQELLNLQKIYKCFACQKQFQLSYYLKLHVRSHTDEKPYICAQCGQSFITASKLGRHNKRFHLAIRYQCRICYRYFSRFEFLTRHFDKKHPDDKLEGEPYDYNAILPYLKELEEQLKEKQEQDKNKPKNEDPWSGDWSIPNTGSNVTEQSTSKDDNKEKSKEEDQKENYKMDIDIKIDRDIKEEDDGNYDSVNIVIEPEKVDVKEENEGEAEKNGEDVDDVKNESDWKDENMSDDDYFPSNTWAASPECEPVVDKVKKTKDEDKHCPTCNKKINTASYMRVHMRTHTGERPFKCYICNLGFITASKMHRHVLTHPESWEDTEIKNEIKSENEDNPDKNPSEKKKKKLKMKKALFALKKKTKTGFKERPHACEYCHKRFLHLETLQVHKKSHKDEPLILRCNFCLTEMPDQEALKAHEGTHEGPKPYLCTLCGKCYKKKETMIYHRKNHKPDREYICDICTKTFNAECKLQRHLASHRTDKFILRYECPVCAHMFNTKYHVQMHLSTHQKEGLIQEENRNEILAMVLQNARKIPKQPDHVGNLTDTLPSDERSRVCNICGQVFQHFYYLEEHLKSHGSKIALEDNEKVEEKKHVCTVCNKSFKLHYYLKLHSFTHTKEKPFICQQCGKGFITRGKLKRHLETHSGLKKYQCHICYKFFTRPSYLRIHVRTIHGTQDYNFRLENLRAEVDYPVGHSMV